MPFLVDFSTLTNLLKGLLFSLTVIGFREYSDRPSSVVVHQSACELMGDAPVLSTFSLAFDAIISHILFTLFGCV